MEVLDEIHAANMHNWSTNARRQDWAENNHQYAEMHLLSDREKMGILSQVSALRADSLQVVCLPPIDSELCRRSLLDLSPVSEDQ